MDLGSVSRVTLKLCDKSRLSLEICRIQSDTISISTRVIQVLEVKRQESRMSSSVFFRVKWKRHLSFLPESQRNAKSNEGDQFGLIIRPTPPFKL